MSFADSYGVFDRLLHRFAFATTWAQRGVADLEQKLFRRELDAVDPGAPVFVTALPRAGTTILLELLAGLDEFASHRYRDMPFVLTPMLWSRFVGSGDRDAAPQERAHGDGIQISQDSPEAFEEMLWRAFWRSHYPRDRIAPWSRCDEPEFVEFLVAHMRKVIALRAREKPARRYVSKNNLNIARVPSLLDAIPGAALIVPLRDPVQHASSLLRQHQRFTSMHDEDAFARRYMEGVGHFDFGRNLKPVDFDGWMTGRDVSEADGLAFWLDYWVAAYRHVRAHAGHERLLLVRFEALDDDRTLDAIAGHADIAPDQLRARAAILKPPAPRDVDTSAVPASTLDAAHALHAELQQLAPA